MGNYWGINVVSGVMNILGALGIIAGVLYFFNGLGVGFGLAFGIGSIFGGIVLIANAQLLTLAVGLARNVARIAESMTHEA